MKKPKPMSVDRMTQHVAAKFPSYSVKLPTRGFEFGHGTNIREVVLFVRKLCRK